LAVTFVGHGEYLRQRSFSVNILKCVREQWHVLVGLAWCRLCISSRHRCCS